MQWKIRTPDFSEEQWLALYIKLYYKKLGFDSLEGPFARGYDFRGIYNGEKVVVEAEIECKNFILHGHNSKEVDILIVLDNVCTGVCKGMNPSEWKKLLPNKIITVDFEDYELYVENLELEDAMRLEYGDIRGLRPKWVHEL